MIDLSVIISTFNPNIIRLNAALDGLKKQSFSLTRWELIVIDNNSDTNLKDEIDLSWHPQKNIVQESKQGLTYARTKGFLTAMGNIVILVDDDNILDENYLKETVDIFESHPSLGAVGGKSLPIFETAPPLWINNFHKNLALRDLGNNIVMNLWEENKYPSHAPIGAGMAIRKVALASYIEKISSEKTVISDRVGNSLSSSGDNDIVLEVLKSGWQTGYFPILSLSHIIPKERLSAKYLGRLLNNSNKSWVKLLESHGMNPWSKIPSWTVSLRKIKAWFVYQAWKNPVNFIKWKGACGTFDALSREN